MEKLLGGAAAVIAASQLTSNEGVEALRLTTEKAKDLADLLEEFANKLEEENK